MISLVLKYRHFKYINTAEKSIASYKKEYIIRVYNKVLIKYKAIQSNIPLAGTLEVEF